MRWIDTNIDWILIVSGLGTATMLAMTALPSFTTRFLFGEDITTRSGVVIAKSWGMMIFLSGMALVYAAFHPWVRVPVMLYSLLGKLSFVVPVFAAPQYRNTPAFGAAIADLVIAALFAWYLWPRLF
jgi:hypothetical protein